MTRGGEWRVCSCRLVFHCNSQLSTMLVRFQNPCIPTSKPHLAVASGVSHKKFHSAQSLTKRTSVRHPPNPSLARRCTLALVARWPRSGRGSTWKGRRTQPLCTGPGVGLGAAHRRQARAGTPPEKSGVCACVGCVGWGGACMCEGGRHRDAAKRACEFAFTIKNTQAVAITCNTKHPPFIRDHDKTPPQNASSTRPRPTARQRHNSSTQAQGHGPEAPPRMRFHGCGACCGGHT